eukprot:jgi/Bigna1/83577/fgenesh1_pg.111_\
MYSSAAGVFFAWLLTDSAHFSMHKTTGIIDQKGKYKIQVSNIPAAMQWQDLKDLGMRYGDSVTFARTYKVNGVPGGYIEYKDRADAEEALKKINTISIEGRNVDARWGEESSH